MKKGQMFRQLTHDSQLAVLSGDTGEQDLWLTGKITVKWFMYVKVLTTLVVSCVQLPPGSDARQKDQ